MRPLECWFFSRPTLHDVAHDAARAEALGFDGMTLTDSQNLMPDTYVALTLAARATTRLRLGPGVTNPATRHAAVTAGAIASINEVSGGRAVLGIGRGDSALQRIGRTPAPVRELEHYLQDVQRYLRGESVEAQGVASRLEWLDPSSRPKVPMDVAATGPRVIAAAARHAERVTFAVGADPRRVRWALERLRESVPAGRAVPSAGVWVNVCVDDDVGRAAEMVRGTVGTFAHFSAMRRDGGWPVDAGDTPIYRDLGESYDHARHGRGDAGHARRLPLAFIERFAVIGPPETCRSRLAALVATGIDRLVVIGPRTDHFGEPAWEANERFAKHVMPLLRGAAA